MSPSGIVATKDGPKPVRGSPARSRSVEPDGRLEPPKRLPSAPKRARSQLTSRTRRYERSSEAPLHFALPLPGSQCETSQPTLAGEPEGSARLLPKERAMSAPEGADAARSHPPKGGDHLRPDSVVLVGWGLGCARHHSAERVRCFPGAEAHGQIPEGITAALASQCGYPSCSSGPMTLPGRRSGQRASGHREATRGVAAPHACGPKPAGCGNPRASRSWVMGFTRTEPMSGVHVKERFRRTVSR